MDAGTRQPRFPGLRSKTALARRRLVMAMGVCVGVVFIVASAANRQRITLKCIDGTLVAFRGRPFPAGEAPLPAARFPPLSVDEAACRDQPFSSVRDLEARYVALTLSAVDDAIASDDATDLEHAADTVDRLGDRPDLEESMGQRRRALLVSLLESDLEDASAVLGRLRARLRAAKAAGVSPTVLRAIEDELRALLGDAAPPEPATTDIGGDDAASAPPVKTGQARSL